MSIGSIQYSYQLPNSHSYTYIYTYTFDIPNFTLIPSQETNSNTILPTLMVAPPPPPLNISKNEPNICKNIDACKKCVEPYAYSIGIIVPITTILLFLVYYDNKLVRFFKKLYKKKKLSAVNQELLGIPGFNSDFNRV